MTYFPFADYWWFYFGFSGFVLLLLALDLGVFHRKAHTVSFREASLWSAVWISLALAFNFALYGYAAWKFARDPALLAAPGFDPDAAARHIGIEFLAGYVVEKTLSLDNIFVFVIVFTFFAIPALYQHRILFFGLIGALACRAVFIMAGAALLQYHWMSLLFGAFLIGTGVKMAVTPEKKLEPEMNPLIRLFKRFVPVTGSLHGQRFFIRRKGALHATPLFVALLFIEMSDIVFAIDSVPAIFAITREPMVVFTSNIFAILGLRSLYFLLANAMERFTHLRYGLAAVLVFVGLKMIWLNDLAGGEFPIGWSLAIIASMIGTAILFSLLSTKSKALNGARISSGYLALEREQRD